MDAALLGKIIELGYQLLEKEPEEEENFNGSMAYLQYMRDK